MTPASGTAAPTDHTRPRGVLAWALWDWGAASFNAVVTTFVFTVYLAQAGFGTEAEVNSQLGFAMAIAGVIIAVLAPVLGQRGDTVRGRRRPLAVSTAVVIVIIAALFFIAPEPSLLTPALALLAIGSIFYEIASVHYNAMLTSVSTPKTLGRVSGFGWGMGYIGGIVLLLILYVGLIAPEVGFFGVTSENGMDVRVSMLFAAAWFALFALPVILRREAPLAVAAPSARLGLVASYRKLGRDIAAIWRERPEVIRFLIASAVFRDGLTGVFTFGGVLAGVTFGFSASEVMLFAIAANVVAGIVTITVGLLDDRIGPRPIIITSLIGLIVAGSTLFFLHDGGKTTFWIFGLTLCLFVGPAQSASRTMLSRMTPVGREGEMFGLYATTGRAVSFLAPLCFGLAVSIGGQQYWGILGIVLVVAIGLVLILRVPAARKETP